MEQAQISSLFQMLVGMPPQERDELIGNMLQHHEPMEAPPRMPPPNMGSGGMGGAPPAQAGIRERRIKRK